MTVTAAPFWLDVIIPTYNRATSLERSIKSVLAAPVPEGKQVRVIVSDNKSTDDTREVVERLTEESNGRVLYVAATDGQGSSFARNSGIASSTAELLGFIDDDEEIDSTWVYVAFAAFVDPTVDYIGGPANPQWPMTPPEWINHPHTRTAIGWADFGGIRRRFDENFDAMLLGGNGVLRRRCFDKIGMYTTTLGRTSKRLLGGEDTDLYARLLAAGLKGYYHPELVIHHHISPHRMKKSYMRSWAFWASASDGFGRRDAKQSGTHVFGLPLYLYRKALEAPLRWGKARLANHGPAQAFHHELTLWRLAGLLYGRNLMTHRTIEE